MVSRNCVRRKHRFFKIRSITLWFTSCYSGDTFVLRGSFMAMTTVSQMHEKAMMKLQMLSLSSHNRARVSEFIFVIKVWLDTQSFSDWHKIQADVVVWTLSQQHAGGTLVGGLHLCAELDLRCGMWGLSLQDADSGCVRGSGMNRLQEWVHRGPLAGGADSVFAARDLFACGILVPRPGIEPAFPALLGGFLTPREVLTVRFWRAGVEIYAGS